MRCNRRVYFGVGFNGRNLKMPQGDDDFPAFLIGWNLKMLNSDDDFPKFLAIWGVMFAGIVLLLFVITRAGDVIVKVG